MKQEDKKQYQTPQLTIHGQLEDVTQSQSVVGNGDALFTVLIT